MLLDIELLKKIIVSGKWNELDEDNRLTIVSELIDTIEQERRMKFPIVHFLVTKLVNIITTPIIFYLLMLPYTFPATIIILCLYWIFV